MLDLTPIIDFSQKLSDQPWSMIGVGDAAIEETSDKTSLIEQLVSILTLRLTVLLSSRKNTALTVRSIVDQIMHEDKQNCDLIGNTVHEELCQFVSRIASLYRDNGYHSLQHATHVTTSFNKLITLLIDNDRKKNEGREAPFMRAYTAPVLGVESGNFFGECPYSTTSFGIGNDPLLHFAMVFAALVHDVDHRGVSNRQLVIEGDELCMLYNDRSVAEQHSLSVAFSTIMDPDFAELRHVVFPTSEERRIFRKYVINLVLITDISCPERVQIVKSKWKEAFEPARRGSREQSQNNINRRKAYASFSYASRLGIKRALQLSGSIIEPYANTHEGDMMLRASSVMEHMLQIADVAHTMQSWPVFIKWNKMLYHEKWVAFKARRGPDPSINTFSGEILFLDFYIIPLAKKILKSEVFGEIGNIFLDGAREIRRRWLIDGEKYCFDLLTHYERCDIRREVEPEIEAHKCLISKEISGT